MGTVAVSAGDQACPGFQLLLVGMELAAEAGRRGNGLALCQADKNEHGPLKLILDLAGFNSHTLQLGGLFGGGNFFAGGGFFLAGSGFALHIGGGVVQAVSGWCCVGGRCAE